MTFQVDDDDEEEDVVEGEEGEGEDVSIFFPVFYKFDKTYDIKLRL